MFEEKLQHVKSYRRNFLLLFEQFQFTWYFEVSSLMMIIAFITINSGLVSLIEGLCAQIWYFRFEIIGDLRSHLLLFFLEEKICSRKKQSAQDLITLLSIYIYMCTLYTYTNICVPIFGASGLFGPSRFLIPTPGLTSEYPMQCVCVCVRIHTLTHTYTPTLVKNREDTDNTPIFTSVKNKTIRQATSAFID